MIGRPKSLFDCLQNRESSKKSVVEHVHSSSSPVTPENALSPPSFTSSSGSPLSSSSFSKLFSRDVEEDKPTKRMPFKTILPRKRYKSAGETSNLLSNVSDPSHKAILSSYFPPQAFNKNSPEEKACPLITPAQQSSYSLPVSSSLTNFPAKPKVSSQSNEQVENKKPDQKKPDTKTSKTTFIFSSDNSENFPMSGKLESSVIKPNSNFVKLNSLLSKNLVQQKSRSTPPITPNSNKLLMIKKTEEDDDEASEEEPNRAFKITSEQVTHQRMISVEREECHKKEHAVISLETNSDLQQQRTVTVCRSNTWGCDDTPVKIKHYSNIRKLPQHPAISEDNFDSDKVPQDTSPLSRGLKPTGALSDGSETSPPNNDSKAPRHIVKSFSIIDKDFRINKSGLWSKEPTKPIHDRLKRASSRDSIEFTTDPNEKNLYQRSILIQRDDDGYGLQVMGSSPVIVSAVKPGGAAYRAGIQEGDKFLKINGSQVTKWDHQEIFNLMEICPFMDLTLLTLIPYTPTHGRSLSPTTLSSNPRLNEAPMDSQFENLKLKTLRIMYKQTYDELKYVKQQYDKNPSEDLSKAMNHKRKIISQLQQQIHSLQRNLLDQQDSQISSSSPQNASSPLSSPSSLPQSNHQIEDPMLFHDLELLKKHPTQLSVFLNFVLSIFDPSPLLFHIVTDSYEQGGSKEMRKWAYEIYSIFVQPKAPLKVNLNEAVANEIERKMIEVRDNEEEMKSLFVEARNFVSKEINYQLSEFRTKRSQGANHTYEEEELKKGPDKSSEAKTVENGLWSYFERLNSNQKVNDRCKALASSLATFFKISGLSNSRMNATLDRCYIFNAKDKKMFKFKTNRKIYNGHQYSPQQYFHPTYCYWCHIMFWGIGHQGFQCSHCGLNMHKRCIEGFREPCVGMKKKKDRRTTTSVFDKIISRKTSANNHLAIKEAQSQYHLQNPNPGFSTPSILNCPSNLYPSTPDSSHSGKKIKFKHRLLPFKRALSMPSINDLPPFFLIGHKNSLTSLLRSSRDSLKGKFKHKEVEVEPAPKPHEYEEQRDNNVCRSESLQSRGNSRTNVRRTHSDVTPENQQALNDSSESSSNSSLSIKSSEHSDYISNDDLNNQQSILSTTTNLHPFNSFSSFSSSPPHHALQQQHSLLSPKTQQQQFKNLVSSSVSSLFLNPNIKQSLFDTDPDFDVESDLPCVEAFIPKEIFKTLKPKEKKRQEVINELFHTERAHLRNIKVMFHLFHQPMLHDSNPVTKDLAYLLFPNIRELIECHKSINDEFQAKRKEQPLVLEVAHILESKFSGLSGARFKRAAATFCQNQSHALEVLKTKMKKDTKLMALLQESASHPLCRRLQLKDLIPTEMQRLTKYPLLIETLIKHTSTGSDEYEGLKRSLNFSKEILSYVNKKVEDCENHQKLIEFQKRMDRKPIENSTHPVLVEYKRLDLTRHRMIYDGWITWRICRTKQLDVHAILLEDILVLLQRVPDSDKLILKSQSSSTTVASTSSQPVVMGVVAGTGAGAKEDKHTHSPIVKLTNLLLRNVATDKRAFFLVSISEFGPQIYEFITPNKDEKNKWFRYISEAAEQYKQRKGNKDANKVMLENLNRSKTTSPTPAHAHQRIETAEMQEKPPSFVSTPVQSPQISRVSSPIQEPLSMEIAVSQKIEEDCKIFDDSNKIESEENMEPPKDRQPSSDKQVEEEEEGEDDDDHAYITTVQKGSYHTDDLIQPSEVKVTKFEILEKPLPIHQYTEALERARSSYKELLNIKKQLVSDLLKQPLSQDPDMSIKSDEKKDVRELLLLMMVQTDKLVNVVSQASNFKGDSSLDPTVGDIDRSKLNTSNNSFSSSPVDKSQQSFVWSQAHNISHNQPYVPKNNTNNQKPKQEIKSSQSNTSSHNNGKLKEILNDTNYTNLQQNYNQIPILASSEILTITSKLNHTLTQLMETMTREESKKQQNVSNDNNTFNEDGSIINTKSNSQETSKKVNSECEKKTECTEQKMVGNYSHKDKDGAFTESYSHENTKNVLNNFFKNEEINQKNVFSDNEIKGDSSRNNEKDVLPDDTSCNTSSFSSSVSTTIATFLEAILSISNSMGSLPNNANNKPKRSVTKTTNTLNYPVVTPGDVRMFAKEETLLKKNACIFSLEPPNPTNKTSVMEDFKIQQLSNEKQLDSQNSLVETSISTSKNTDDLNTMVMQTISKPAKYPQVTVAHMIRTVPITLTAKNTLLTHQNTTTPSTVVSKLEASPPKSCKFYQAKMLLASVVDGPLIETGPTENIKNYTAYVKGPFNTTTISTRDSHVMIRCISKNKDKKDNLKSERENNNADNCGNTRPSNDFLYTSTLTLGDKKKKTSNDDGVNDAANLKKEAITNFDDKKTFNELIDNNNNNKIMAKNSEKTITDKPSEVNVRSKIGSCSEDKSSFEKELMVGEVIRLEGNQLERLRRCKSPPLPTPIHQKLVFKNSDNRGSQSDGGI